MPSQIAEMRPARIQPRTLRCTFLERRSFFKCHRTSSSKTSHRVGLQERHAADHRPDPATKPAQDQHGIDDLESKSRAIMSEKLHARLTERVRNQTAPWGGRWADNMMRTAVGSARGAIAAATSRIWYIQPISIRKAAQVASECAQKAGHRST